MLLDNRTVRVIEVEVTPEDIANGYAAADVYVGGLANTCAIAQALGRTLGGRWGVTYSSAVKWRGYYDIEQAYTHDGDTIARLFDMQSPITGLVRLTPVPAEVVREGNV